MEQWLRGEIDSLPALQASHCKVGRWIENDGQDRFLNNSVLTKLMIHHERLHRAGEQAVDARARGDEQAVHESLSAMYEYRDNVLSTLRLLERD